MPHHFLSTRGTGIVEPSINWLLRKDVPHKPSQVNSRKCEIFAQLDIIIQPKSSLSVQLGLGVLIPRGRCLISLRQEIKARNVSLQDDIISEDVVDIMITIQNNSETLVTIPKGSSLCYVNYQLTPN